MKNFEVQAENAVLYTVKTSVAFYGYRDHLRFFYFLFLRSDPYFSSTVRSVDRLVRWNRSAKKRSTSAKNFPVWKFSTVIGTAESVEVIAQSQ